MKEFLITEKDLSNLQSVVSKKEVLIWIESIISKNDMAATNKLTCQAVIDLFNITCKDLPKVSKLTNARKSAILARIKEHSIKVVVQVINITANSDYLMGKVKPFNATFDWIMNPNNFVKILEGNYKNKPTAGVPSGFHKNN